MLLTKPQQLRFWREWSAAVKNQGWQTTWTNAQIEAERKALLQRAGFTSLTLVDRAAGYDKVLSELSLLQDKIDPQLTTESGERRRLLHLIRKHAQPLGGEPYINRIARDKFHLVTGLKTIEDLETYQLTQLLITLNARRLRHVIRTDLLPCLALNKPGSTGHAATG